MSTPTNYQELVGFVLDFINILIPTFFGIFFLYFIWKIVDSWIISAADETKRTEGKKYAVVAVLMFVLMVSTWGIVNMLKTTFFG